MDLVVSKLIDEFKLKSFQVENAVKLIDEGNTIPFIATPFFIIIYAPQRHGNEHSNHVDAPKEHRGVFL